MIRVAPLLLLLAGCGAITREDVTACAWDIAQQGPHTAEAVALAAALAPACQALAAEAVEAAVHEVMQRLPQKAQ